MTSIPRCKVRVWGCALVHKTSVSPAPPLYPTPQYFQELCEVSAGILVTGYSVLQSGLSSRH